MSNREKNFRVGYRHGISGMPCRQDLVDYPGYLDGWDSGNCDRPTLDELLPLDAEKEASTGCLA